MPQRFSRAGIATACVFLSSCLGAQAATVGLATVPGSAFITTGYETWYSSDSSRRCLTADDRGRVIGTMVTRDSSPGPSSTARVRLPAGYTHFLRKHGSLQLFVVIMDGEHPRCRKGSVDIEGFDAYYSGVRLHFRRDGTTL